MQDPIGAPDVVVAVRGSAVPFTAPSLFGARARLAGRGLELLLPNPSGTRGVYVMNWAMASDAATPSLHDAMLGRALAELAEVSPATVRSAGREIAAAGYAGRAARSAAIGVQERMARAITELWRDLACGMARDSALPAEQTRRLIEGMAGAQAAAPGLEALASRLNWPPPVLSDALARLARHYVGVTGQGRATLLLQRAALLREKINGNGNAIGAQAAAGELDPFLEQARQAVEAARTMINSPGRLLAIWRSDPARALAPAERVETLLDGWERILALWSEPDHAREGDGGAMPADAALLMRLALGNLAGTAQLPAGERAGATAARPHDPSAPARLCRNEQVRAAELALEHGQQAHG